MMSVQSVVGDPTKSGFYDMKDVRMTICVVLLLLFKSNTVMNVNAEWITFSLLNNFHQSRELKSLGPSKL